MSPTFQKDRLILISIACGVLTTMALTIMAFMGDSRAWGCIWVWQACLVQVFIHTPENSVHEGSPIDLFAFGFGILLGVPIYSGLAYVLLSRWNKAARREEDELKVDRKQ
jgi:hypothetical protein